QTTPERRETTTEEAVSEDSTARDGSQTTPEGRETTVKEDLTTRAPEVEISTTNAEGSTDKPSVTESVTSTTEEAIQSTDHNEEEITTFAPVGTTESEGVTTTVSDKGTSVDELHVTNEVVTSSTVKPTEEPTTEGNVVT